MVFAIIYFVFLFAFSFTPWGRGMFTETPLFRIVTRRELESFTLDVIEAALLETGQYDIEGFYYTTYDPTRDILNFLAKK